MAVKRSPFSKVQPSGLDDGGTPVYDRLKGGTKVPVPDSPSKTSLIAEKQKLEQAKINAMGRISRASVPDPEAIKSIQQIAATGKGGKKDDGAVGFVKDVALSPIRAVGTLFKAGQTVSNYAQSGIKEVGDGLMDILQKAGLTNENAEIHAKGNSASWSDFIKQGKDKEFKLFDTGKAWIDNPMNFATDVATDPLTYFSFGTGTFSGAAGRATLAAKFGTTEMLAKHPSMVGKLDDILRYGEWAIPKPIRDAEGIKTGIRFAGKLIPKTEKLAQGVVGKYGPISGTRRMLGDALDMAAPSVKRALTPKSLKPLVEAGAGRGFKLLNEDVVPLLAHNTARRFSRGATVTAYQQNVGGVRDVIKDLRKLGPDAMDTVRKAVDDADIFNALPKGELRDNAIKYKAWQDSLRNSVNEVYKKFGDDFGSTVREVGFVDDYLHHRLTSKAAEVVLNPKYKKFFKDEDLTAEELTGVTGAMRHRRLHKPKTNPETGETVYAEFMGEKVQNGTIDEINKIFKDKTGLDVDFFETDLGSIADSYAYSMAKARGRESYFRRLMDFGDDTVSVVGKELVADKDLVNQLSAAHKGLIKARNELGAKVAKGKTATKGKAQDALKFAQDILDGKASKGADIERKVSRVRQELADIEQSLTTALVSAQSKQAAAREGFLEVYGPLLEEVRVLRTALDNGQAEEYAAIKQLKQIYAAMHPNAKRIPDELGALKEAIDRKAGVANPKEVREINKRLNSIRQQLSEPVEDAEFHAQLMAEEKRLLDQVAGFEKLGSVRVQADYAQDGVLYGKVDDLTVRQVDPNDFDQMPFRTLDSKVIDPNNVGYDDGGSAFFDTWRTEQDSVMVQAIPTEELVDLRDPDGFLWFFSPENNVHIGLGEAMNRAGLDGGAFISEYESALAGGVVDPMFEEIFPEMSDLLYMVYNADQLEFPEGIVEEDVLNSLFDGIRGNLQGIAASQGLDNSDLVGKQMYEDFLGFMAEAGVGDQQGLVLPSTLVYGSDNLSAQGAYSVVIPDRYSYTKGASPEDLAGGPRSKVHFVSESPFAGAVLDNEFEGASLIANEALSNTVQKLAGIEGQELIRTELASEAKKLAGKKGAIKADVARKTKAAEKAVRRFQDAGVIGFKVNGKYIEMPRDQVLKALGAKEKKIKSAYERLYAEVDKIVDNETRAVIAKKTSYEQRLASLFNQKKSLQKWDDNVGAQLRNDIAALEKSIMDEPPEGASGAVARAWVDKVQRTMEGIPQLQDSKFARAYERVTTTLHADEAMLAILDSEQIPDAAAKITAAKSGWFNGKLQKDVYDGWREIESLGLQVPEEVDALWRPNIDKLRSLAERNKFMKAYKAYHSLFKIYAMATTGFSIRNAMSATFMNWVQGVSYMDMIEGAMVGRAISKNPTTWLDDMGLEGAERELYEKAWRATEATGRGMGDELASPVMKGVGSKLMNNKFTRFFGGLNDYVERSVRFPLALDSLKKGMSYDEAVERVARIHFDYSDLSSLDEKAMSVVPFWIWTTRNIPLQVTQMWTRPSAYSIYDKVREHNPVNEELIIPSWISDMGAMGTFGANDRFVLTPDLPMNRLEKSATDLFSTKMLGQLNPLIKVPIETLVADKQLALDIPFSDQYQKAKGIDKAVAALGEFFGADALGKRDPKTGELLINPKFQYAIPNIIPPLAQAERLSGGAVGGKGTYDERQLSSLLTYLGLPAREVDLPLQQRSEIINRQFKIKDYLKYLEGKGKLGEKIEE